MEMRDERLGVRCGEGGLGGKRFGFALLASFSVRYASLGIGMRTLRYGKKG